MPKSIHTDAHSVLLKALIDARKAAGVTQVELAKRLGKKQAFVSSIETGVRRVDVIEFYAIGKALKLDSVALYAAIVKKLPKTVEV